MVSYQFHYPIYYPRKGIFCFRNSSGPSWIFHWIGLGSVLSDHLQRLCAPHGGCEMGGSCWNETERLRVWKLGMMFFYIFHMKQWMNSFGWMMIVFHQMLNSHQDSIFSSWRMLSTPVDFYDTVFFQNNTTSTASPKKYPKRLSKKMWMTSSTLNPNFPTKVACFFYFFPAADHCQADVIFSAQIQRLSFYRFFFENNIFIITMLSVLLGLYSLNISMWQITVANWGR